ncbi:probable beta-1 3-galactosyltransferase 2 [Phtheirospermum japonicum]|uniref:Hexosyltransferase n=1 Tax=Phtheirospermum japonicum TaxID=374723 RepID=A0A830CLI7_9LAMI|nr:probable beta-1 3-galactosyltransferase 2 [Phtheirospermum japonicum]
MSLKSRGMDSSSKNFASRKFTFLLCIGCFCAGMLFTDRMWSLPEAKDIRVADEKLKLVSDGRDPKVKNVKSESRDVLRKVSKTHHSVKDLDRTISNLEMELAGARAVQDSLLSGSPISEDIKMPELANKRKYLMVVGINTAFSSRKRRDSVRATWMLQGDKRKKLEEEKGIIIRFVIGHSATSGGILDRAIEAEDKKHGDFLRLDHVEGYLELSAKTKTYFTTAVALWDADFYVKVDDDVHVNIAMGKVRDLDRTISNLEMELAGARAVQDSLLSGATSGGILDRPLKQKIKKHGDFLRLLDCLYIMSRIMLRLLELSAKTKTYFTTAVALWDADFYVKVDDDVHVNIATLGATLARHRSRPRVYIGCMKSGPVLAQKGVRYHEPEHWKFGGQGNKYFRHATGQLYAISKDLATYISINQHVLHKYANEDVSLGSWFIGLDVEHIDDRRLCCGTPPDCEWKAQAGNVCVASFDWSCSGICNSADRMKDVHRRCGEGETALWSSD